MSDINIKQFIKEYIRDNEERGITGQVLQNVLIAMVDDTTGEVEIITTDINNLKDTVNNLINKVTDLSNDVNDLEERDVFLTEDEYDDLVESGQVDPDKIYHTYEE